MKKFLFSLALAIGLLTSFQPAMAGPSYEYTVLYAFGNFAANTTDGTFTKSPAGTGTVAGITGRRIRMLSYTAITGSTATALTFNSKGAGAGTAITSQKQFGANGGVSPGGFELGHFETKTGETITVTTGTGSTTGVDISYVFE